MIVLLPDGWLELDPNPRATPAEFVLCLLGLWRSARVWPAELLLLLVRQGRYFTGEQACNDLRTPG